MFTLFGEGIARTLIPRQSEIIWSRHSEECSQPRNHLGCAMGNSRAEDDALLITSSPHQVSKEEVRDSHSNSLESKYNYGNECTRVMFICGNIWHKRYYYIKWTATNIFKFSTYEYIDNNDAIFNLATTSGKSGIAIFRISGDKSRQVLQYMTNKSLDIFTSSPRKLIHCNIHVPNESKNILDICLAVWFPKPHSFTGEDTVELHTHGSQAVIKSVSSALSTLPFTRPSLPGEFTRRAFNNGKLDLTEVEGLGDLINAETDVQRSIALQQLQGHIKQKYQSWRIEMIQLLAQLEAYIDFSEDENIEQDTLNTTLEKLLSLSSSISEQQSHSTTIHQIIRDGIHITIAGPPNAGKSTLLNHLAMREAAIVSSIPGTTRDIIHITCQLSGQLVHFYDTAGIRLSSDLDPIEKIGIERSLESIKSCNICIYMLDSLSDTNLSDQWTFILNNAPPTCPFFILLNKNDKSSIENSFTPDITTVKHQLLGVHYISMTALKGVQEWINSLQDYLKSLSPLQQSLPIITNERHKHHLAMCMTHLSQSIDLINDPVLSAEELRQAARHLDQVTGSVILQDDILSSIFQQFCIGK